MTTVQLAMRVADHLWEFRSKGDDDDVPGRKSRPRPLSDVSRAAHGSLPESPSHANEDQLLVQRLRAGDSDAWRELLRSYGAWLIDVADVIVHSPDLAQDVVQDVFIRLWDIRDRLEIRGKVAPYLYRAVRNRAMNARTHERAEQTARDRLAWERGNDAARDVTSRNAESVAEEFEQAVQQALAELSPKLREIFLLRVDQGWSNAEIADALGIAVASVRQQMYRATKMLAERLAPWLESAE